MWREKTVAGVSVSGTCHRESRAAYRVNDVEEAVRGIPGAGAAAADRADMIDDSDGQILIVRPRIVETVGHVLGNMFQRLYHLVGRAHDSDPATAEELEGSTRQLEDFLQLVLDYFSPLTLALQYVPAVEIPQSFARQVSDVAGCAVKVDAKLAAEDRVLVDPGRLTRSFSLLATQLGVAPEGTIGLDAAIHGRSMLLRLRIPAHQQPPWSSQAEMRWAVAEKFLDLHGATVRRQTVPSASGEILWEIVLPLQP